MPTPQPGIFALGTRCHHHLELDVAPGVEPDALTGALARLLEPGVVPGAANVVLGFGASTWARIAPAHAPADLGPFVELVGRDGHRAPATQHDVWAWVHGAGPDEVLDCALAVTAALAGVAGLAAETPSFVYHDSRDLTGFVDGTANPAPAAAPGVACVPDGAAGAGGSHVLAQRWVHDLAGFSRLGVAEQEGVFGRTKPDSVALPADVRPGDSHITRAEIHDAQGRERPVYRRSTPFGTVAERGLFFLAFSAERDRFDQMLASMYGTGGREQRDRLLDFSTAVSGSYYFAPSLEALGALVSSRGAGAA